VPCPSRHRYSWFFKFKTHANASYCYLWSFPWARAEYNHTYSKNIQLGLVGDFLEISADSPDVVQPQRLQDGGKLRSISGLIEVKLHLVAQFLDDLGGVFEFVVVFDVEDEVAYP